MSRIHRSGNALTTWKVSFLQFFEKTFFRSPIDSNGKCQSISKSTPVKFPQTYSFLYFLGCFVCHPGHTQVDCCEVFGVPSVKTISSHLKIAAWEMKSPFVARPDLLVSGRVPSLKTNMTMQNHPFEDVSPIKHGASPLSC